MEKGCRNCMWLYHMVTYNPTAPCSECLDYNKWQTTKKTHYDKIRAMSMEEIAEIMVSDCPPNYPHDDCREYKKWDGNLDCQQCWLNWLKQEVEEGE